MMVRVLLMPGARSKYLNFELMIIHQFYLLNHYHYFIGGLLSIEWFQSYGNWYVTAPQASVTKFQFST
jgi:hypothetical protein